MAVKFHKVSADLTKKEYTQLHALLKANGLDVLAKKLTVYEPKKDLVTITCYRETEVKERKAAIKFYQMAADNSDGCERERYLIILDGLQRGLKTVSDED